MRPFATALSTRLAVCRTHSLLWRPVFSHRLAYYSTSSPFAPPPSQSPPVKKRIQSTLGPDAGNPTKVTQPAFTKSGQLLRVNMTESAAKKLAEVREKEQRPDLVLRIHVESGGCHGFQYVFELPDISDAKETDSIFERDGSKIIIDHRSLRILRDATIDYTTELIGSQFKVQSPHTSSSCGCGSSFSLDMED